MRPGIRQDDPRQGMRLIEADVPALSSPGPRLIGQGCCSSQEGQSACGKGETALARREEGGGVQRQPHARTGGAAIRKACKNPGGRLQIFGLVKKAVPDGCPAAIHDQQAGLDRGAVFGESTRGKRHCGHHDAVAF